MIETRTALQAPGAVVFKSIEADVAPEIALPAAAPLRPDPLISPDGRFAGRDDFEFATLSDVQFTAASQELTKVAIAALHRIRRDDPDLVVLNGDIVDTGSAADLTLARATLEAGGCDLIAAGEPLPARPERGTVPCLYVPGNHESYLANGSQGTLDPWIAEFGRPYRTLDHEGTRFVLLNSALGSLRGSGFDQLPMLQDALAEARGDRRVRNVIVFAHHPVDDPDPKQASQLGDRREVELVKKLLADFRTASGKGAAMVGSHAQIVETPPRGGCRLPGAPVLGQVAVRCAGPRRLHRLRALERRPRRACFGALADRRRQGVRPVDHARPAGGAGGRRCGRGHRHDRPAVGRPARHARRAAAVPDVGALERLELPRDRRQRRPRRSATARSPTSIRSHAR